MGKIVKSGKNFKWANHLNARTRFGKGQKCNKNEQTRL
jgi:uncharacterized protein (UPF0548 family)